MDGSLQQLLDGDYTPLEQLYSECMDYFVRLACHRFSCLAAEAEDAFQLAIIATYNNVDSERLRHLTCTLRTYVIGVALHKLINMMEHGEVHLRYCEDQSSGGMPFAKNKIEDDMNREYTQFCLDCCLEQLTKEERSVIELRCIEEEEEETVAEKMNYSNPGTVRNVKSRALKKMRKNGKKPDGYGA
jgi:RNA polymerase sigma factor (sigma-70 family)